MRKFGGLGTGRSPLRQRPQPKNSMTSLASLAEMVGQANEDDYSNIKLCLNSEKPQLELEESHSKNWRNQSPLRRGLNKENDFNQFGNRNIFEANRFADCLIKEKPQNMLKGPGPSPILGNLLSKNRQDVSPGKQRKLQQNDFVFRAGSSNVSKGMNFSQISRKFNEQEDNNELLSYAPSLEQSRPKSRTKAPKLQKQFDEDDFGGDIRESIRQDEFTHKRMMNAGQKQRFENKIEEIKQEKMKLLKDKQHNKTLLPKIIEEIKANATRQIEEFAIYLFNQSKKQQDQSLLEPEAKFPKKSYEERVQEKPKVIIGAKHHVIKPIESHLSKVNNSSEGAWAENQLPLVQSEYPQDAFDARDNVVKIGSPSGIRLEPQPTKLVRGLDLGNSKDVIAASVKEIGLQFSKKQNDLVQELQKKREEQERVAKQREEQQKQRQRQQDLMQQMEAKRKRFQEDARLRQEEANKLQQERIAREQEKLRLENEQRLRREEQLRNQEIERQRELEQEARRIEEERLRREQEERERESLLRKLEEQRLEKERRQAEQRETERQRLQAERVELERIQRELRQADDRARAEAERIERQRRQQQEVERLRLESERIRLEAERLEREKIQLERIQSQRRERERLEAQRIQGERREREEREQREQRQRQIEAERIRAEQQRLRFQQEHRKLQLERLQREQTQRKLKLQRQAEEEQRKKRVLEQYQAETKRIEAERLAQLEKQKAEKQRLERQKPAPVNASFKFDLGGDDLKTSFKFDNLFTNFSLGTPEPTVQETPAFTPSVVISPPLTSLDDLTSNAVKQSINVTSSKAMDFKFDFGLDMDVASSRKFI